MKPHVSRLPAALLAVLLGLSLVCVQAAPAGEAPFSDVAPTAWYALCIQDTQNRDLMQGVAPDTFRPEGTLSRAMAATLLWRLAGTPQPGQPSAFLDVPRDAWYTQAVDWAGEAGVVTGLTPTTFGPNQPVSREQLATLFYRWAQAQGADLSLGVGETVFTYSGSPSAWAKEAVDWAASRYFLVEHPDPAIPGRLLFPQLSPGADATRGETAVFLSRFCQAYLDQAETGLTPVTVQAYGPGYGENIAVSSPGLPPEESQRVFSLAVTIAQMGEPWDRVSFHPSAGHALPQPGSLTEAEQAMTAHYDDHGRLIQVTRVIDGVPRQQYAFQYDSLGRVCYAEDNTEAPGVQYFMTYDQHGNLAYLSVANESLHPAAYAFYYTQAEGAWVLTGEGSAQEDLILF